MNKLSKVLVLILITMLFIGCVKKHRRSHTYYIINETEKSFYVHVDYDEKEIYETRSIYIEGKTEEPILLFTKSGIVLECSSCSYYPASPDQYSEIWFYNIADTSSVNFWELFYSDVMLDDQLRTSIYKTGGECRETERDIDNEYLFRCIHITDEFLDLFEKDYSMLEKFTEYYPWGLEGDFQLHNVGCSIKDMEISLSTNTLAGLRDNLIAKYPSDKKETITQIIAKYE